MRLWIRRKHVLAQYIALLCSFIIMPAVGSRAFLLPGLLGGDSRFPVILITVVPLSLLISHAFSDDTDLERTSVIPLPMFTLVHLTAIYCVTLALSFLASLSCGPDVWIYPRALIGLVSIGLITGSRWGERVSVIAPTLFFCLASLVGTDPYTYQPRWWNFLLADYDGLPAMLVVAILMVLSLQTLLLTGVGISRSKGNDSCRQGKKQG